MRRHGDRLRHPIDPGEEDGYGSSWRREWDGRRYHTREHLTAGRGPLDPGSGFIVAMGRDFYDAVAREGVRKDDAAGAQW